MVPFRISKAASVDAAFFVCTGKVDENVKSRLWDGELARGYVGAPLYRALNDNSRRETYY